jgi:hypothetical protein
MTARQERLDALVDDMLLDAGVPGAGTPRTILVALGSLGSLPVPEPTGDLARLLAAPGRPAGDAVDAADELARRRRRRTMHRPTMMGVALIAGMATGIGGVAASSSAPGQPGSHSVQELLADWSPAWALPVQPLPAGTHAANMPGRDALADAAGTIEAAPLPSLPAPQDRGPALPAPPGAPEPGDARVPAVDAPSGNHPGAGRGDGLDVPEPRPAELPPTDDGVAAGRTSDAPQDTSAIDGDGTNEPAGGPGTPAGGVPRPGNGNPAAPRPALDNWLQKFQR